MQNVTVFNLLVLICSFVSGLYVRPYLDYGDVIYHRDDPEMNSGLTKRRESIQYSAALAVAGAWKSISYDKLFDELGWEYLYHRRWFRRLSHFTA